MMSCLWKQCCFRLSKADQETGAMGETSAGRRHLPRNPPPSRDTPFTPRASSEQSAPKRSPSTKSSSSESNRAKPATKYLSSLLNDTTAPANLRVDFLKGFGIADHSGVGDELRDLSRADGAASHAAPSGLTSEGRNERDASNPTVKSADLAASRARAPAALGLDASRPSDIALSTGWGAATASVVMGGTSSAGNCISCDAGASSSGGAACSCDGSGSAF